VTALPLPAAGAAPAFVPEVVGLLVATALVAYACHRLQVMPIVSFLLTGALIGPHALGLVRDPAVIEGAAELGVVLLLFTLGVEVSLDALARIRRLILLGGGLQVGIVVALVTGLLALLGVDWRAGVFTGCLVALSSTAIVTKLLMSRRETQTEGGQAALGILIFQDLAVVGMVLLVPLLAGGGGGGGAAGGAIALALVKAAIIVTAVLVVARRVMPPLLEAVARTCSQEIFLLTVVAICFGTAYLTSLAGVSLSLGAFLAGLVVSESRFSHMAVGEILPLQILFSATFFVSVGMLLDVGFLVSRPGLVVAAVAGALVIKIAAAGVSLRALGLGTGTVAFTSVLLAQVGEFSFVLERAGRHVSLYPAGLATGGPETFFAATVVLMIATPPLSLWCERLLRRWLPPTAARLAPATGAAASRALHDHVVIAGYGAVGRRLTPALAARAIPHVVVTLSPEGAAEAERDGVSVLRGNYGRHYELSLAGVRDARLLVVADDDPETARRVVAAARALRPDLRVLARAPSPDAETGLREAGAADVVIAGADRDAGPLIDRVLTAWDAAAPPAPADRTTAAAPAVSPADPDAWTLSPAQQHSTSCTHTRAARAVKPGSTGCQECLAEDGSWVHLRLCMTCGHVGCCDQSPKRHARRHHQETGHPIIRSLEPGEGWAWCYEDKAVV
jgi:CPA2 family monovalent cation:H+ antiporter-2